MPCLALVAAVFRTSTARADGFNLFVRAELGGGYIYLPATAGGKSYSAHDGQATGVLAIGRRNDKGVGYGLTSQSLGIGESEKNPTAVTCPFLHMVGPFVEICGWRCTEGYAGLGFGFAQMFVDVKNPDDPTASSQSYTMLGSGVFAYLGTKLKGKKTGDFPFDPLWGLRLGYTRASHTTKEGIHVTSSPFYIDIFVAFGWGS